MSRLSTALQNDLQLLKLLRDETALQAHLFSAEIKQRWQTLDQQWSTLESKVTEAESAAESSAKDAETAIDLLIGSLKSGYENVRSALKS